VRRPHGVRYAVGKIRAPRCFATIGWHHVQLGLLPGPTLRDKGQARAVWRPAGGSIAFGASGETVRRATRRLYDPDIGQIHVLVLREHRYYKGHPSPVG